MGTGLDGSIATGELTLDLDLSEFVDMTATMISTDEFLVLDGGAERRKAANEIGLSIFNNDEGYLTTNQPWYLYVNGAYEQAVGSYSNLDFNAGSNISIAHAGNDITISSTDTTYSAGSGIGLSGTTFSVAAGSGLTQDASGLSHSDTSSQTSINISGVAAGVINSITLDTYGHVTNFGYTAKDVYDFGYTGANDADNYGGWTLLTDSTSRGTISSGENVNIVGGSNVTVGYSATNNTITINATDTSTQFDMNENSGYVGTVTHGESLNIVDGTNTTANVSEAAGVFTISFDSTDTNTTYNAGSGIGLSSTTFSVAAGGGLTQDASGLSHSDTSTQANVSLSGDDVISGLNFDTYGHVTSVSTRSLTASEVGAVVDDESTIWSDTSRTNPFLRSNTGSFFAGSSGTGIKIDPSGVDACKDNFNVMSLAKTSSSTNDVFIGFYRAGSGIGSIVRSGTSVVYNTTSDYRAKNSIMDAGSSWEKVRSVRVREYEMNGELNKKYTGFIAHELQEHIPNAVTGKKDGIYKDGPMKGKPDYQGVDYSKIVPDLTNVVQELMEKVEMLESKIANVN